MRITTNSDSVNKINVEFGYGVKGQECQAKKKTSFLGRLLPKAYKEIYNLYAKLRGLKSRVICDKSQVYTVETSVFKSVHASECKAKLRSKFIERLSNTTTFNEEVQKQGGRENFFENQETKDTFKFLLEAETRTEIRALSNIVRLLMVSSFDSYAVKSSIDQPVADYRDIERGVSTITNSILKEGLCQSLNMFVCSYNNASRDVERAKVYVNKLMNLRTSGFAGAYIHRDYESLQLAHGYHSYHTRENTSAQKNMFELAEGFLTALNGKID